jgi:hypothetical protein
MVTFSGSPAALRAGTKPRLRKFQYEIGVAPPVVEKMKSSSSEWSVPSAPFAPGIPGGPGGPARPRAPRSPCGPRSPCSPRGPRNAVSCLLTAALRSPVWIVPSRIVSPVAVVGLVKVITNPTSEMASAISATTIAGEGARTSVSFASPPDFPSESPHRDPRSIFALRSPCRGCRECEGTRARGRASSLAPASLEPPGGMHTCPSGAGRSRARPRLTPTAPPQRGVRPGQARESA